MISSTVKICMRLAAGDAPVNKVKKTLCIKQLLYQLKKEIRTLIWIPVHADMTHNKEVDMLAKEAQ